MNHDVHENCTCRATGTVVHIDTYSPPLPSIVIVEYKVGQIPYELTETLKYQMHAIRLWGIPLLTRIVPSLGQNINIGVPVRVFYNPDRPTEAYLPDNIGKSDARAYRLL